MKKKIRGLEKPTIWIGLKSYVELPMVNLGRKF
jgi:hypothetical protein